MGLFNIESEKVKFLCQCPTLCDPIDCSLPGSFVHGIFQTRILEWVAFPSPGDLPDTGIKTGSLTLQADSLPTEIPEKPIKIESNKKSSSSVLLTIFKMLYNDVWTMATIREGTWIEQFHRCRKFCWTVADRE